MSNTGLIILAALPLIAFPITIGRGRGAKEKIQTDDIRATITRIEALTEYAETLSDKIISESDSDTRQGTLLLAD